MNDGKGDAVRQMEAEHPEWFQQGFVIWPGDTLLVRVPINADDAMVQEFKRRTRELLPAIDVVVIAAEQIAVVRTGGDVIADGS